MRKLISSAKTKGTVLVLVLVVLTVTILEVALLSSILVRSFGEEAVTASDNTVSRHAVQTAFTRLESDLTSYLLANGTTNVATDFAAGGANAINSVALTTTNPETGTPGEATNATISAEVDTIRGYHYKMKATASIGDVSYSAYRWVKMNPSVCLPSALMTIVSGRPYPGGKAERQFSVDPTTGRVYFGEDNNPGNFYTWHESTGLSTLLAGGFRPGDVYNAINQSTGRVVFGSGSEGFFSYLPATGLSTIVTGSIGGSPHNNDKVVYSHATNGRFYFRILSNFLTWSPSTGLSTIVNSTQATSPGGIRAIDVDVTTGRVYFGEQKSTGADFYTWHPATGLSTILAGTGTNPGRASGLNVFSSLTNSKVLIGAYNTIGGNLYLWSQSGGLSTLLVNRDWPGIGTWGGPTLDFDSTGRAFFGEGDWPGNFYTYASSTGLSTLATTGGFAGVTVNPVTDRVYFGTGLGGYVPNYTWHSSTGLSTLSSVADLSPHFSSVFSPDGTKLYVDEWGPGVWLYDEGAGGSGLTAILGWPFDGYSDMSYDTVNDLVIIPGYSGTDRVMVYDPSSGGLSTIISNARSPGARTGTQTANGTTYFGEYSATGNFYAWNPTSSCGP